MKNNAYIYGFRLKDLLNILDARGHISVYTGEGVKAVREYYLVYELLADSDFIKAYGSYTVSGLVCSINVTNILITEEA